MPVKPGETDYCVALDATLRRVSLRLAARGRSAAAQFNVTQADLCKKLRYRPCEYLIVFAVDASASMGGDWQRRIKAAKGAALSLLRTAYQGRHRVALVAFGGECATVVLPPTGSIDLAAERLKKLPTGGATPMADGLHKACQLIKIERYKSPGLRPILLVISDGEANVPMATGVPPLKELSELARQIRREKINCVFLDAANELGRPSQMQSIASRMGATYKKIEDLCPKHILEAIQKAETGGPEFPGQTA